MLSPAKRLAILAGCLAAGAATAAAATVGGSSGSATVTTSTTVTAGPPVTVTAPASPPERTPPTPAAERTYPRVIPRSGSRRTAFAVHFTLRHDAGHRGVFATDYLIAVSPPANARASCRSRIQAPPVIDSGQAGEVRRVALSVPRKEWCAGRYTVTVDLQRGPYCPPPPPGGRPTPCPLFATQDLKTGTAHFTVASSASR